jgi:hypothetical protein
MHKGMAKVSRGNLNGGISKPRGGGVIRLDHNGDVDMADTRPSRHTRTRGHANSGNGGIRKERGGAGMIQRDHDGDVEMADITRPSQLQHARTKGHADSGIRKQRGSGGVIQLDHDGDVVMADVRPTAFISKRYRQAIKLPYSLSSLGTDEDLMAMGPFNKDQMTAFLGKRYHQQTKLLDLSSLGADPDFVAMGLSSDTTTESSFFSALMRVWGLNFDNLEKSRTAVDSVTLANNCLVDISPVTTLSHAFPNLKNLDLSNNIFKDAQALAGWKGKFRRLEYLDLSDTPFSWDLSFKDTILNWYPKLQTLNKIQVRTAGELAAQFNNRASKHSAKTKRARLEQIQRGR